MELSVQFDIPWIWYLHNKISFPDGGGTSAYEAHLEQKRAAIRKAMKSEWLKQRYNPQTYVNGGHVFDAAMYRWNAMRCTQGDYFYPTIKNFLQFSALTIVPVGLYAYMLISSYVS